MKKEILPIKLLIFFLFFIPYSSNFSAQSRFGIGGFIGGGVISGFSTGQGSFSSSLFFEVDPGLIKDVRTRISFIYCADFEQLLPGSTIKYSPFLKGFSIKAISSQYLADDFFLKNLFVEEGLGLTAINDRTFTGINEWDYGILFSLTSGIDFGKSKDSGLKLGLGAEYAITFWNTFAKYFSFHLQAMYNF